MDSLLNKIAKDNVYGIGMAKISTEYCCNIFKNYLKGDSILELGPADGIMTDKIYPNWGGDYTCVDGAQEYISRLKNKFPKIEAFCSYFEDFKPSHKYDNIILGHVLEHVDNPNMILNLCKSWLNPNGVILCAVPNANSLHRQAAVKMGLLKSIYSFSEKDIHHGHQRIYDPISLKNEFEKAGLKIYKFGGYWLKVLSDSQIEYSWSDKLVNAYMQLGELYLDIAGEIYIIASV